MSKDKSKSSKPKSSLLGKLIKRIFQIAVLAVLVGGVAVLYQPELITDESSRERVLGVRQVIENKYQELAAKPDETSEVNYSLPQVNYQAGSTLVIGDQEIVVDEVITRLSQDLETWPKQAYSTFKSNFCADVVATMAAVKAE